MPIWFRSWDDFRAAQALFVEPRFSVPGSRCVRAKFSGLRGRYQIDAALVHAAPREARIVSHIDGSLEEWEPEHLITTRKPSHAGLRTNLEESPPVCGKHYLSTVGTKLMDAISRHRRLQHRRQGDWCDTNSSTIQTGSLKSGAL